VPLEAIELARKIAETAADKQASDVVLLDTGRVCSFADYFVICSGDNERQIKAIQEAIDEVLKEEAVLKYHREGNAGSGWVLLDIGNIVVHIFAPFERDYYQLESLWGHAPVIVKMI
jgi:ribosome-associated protein